MKSLLLTFEKDAKEKEKIAKDVKM